LVVTPLISLGSDQTQALQQAGIPCAFLSSATTSALSSRSVWDDVESGKIALLYGCPETLLHARDHIVRVEQSVGWTSIAIDEAHCISDWGASFRPAYRQLNQLRQWMPSTPVIALTATATQTVRTVRVLCCYRALSVRDFDVSLSISFQDIIMHLGMKEPVLRAIDTFNRPNLFYQVLRRRTMAEDIKSDLFAGGHSALVYVLRQKDCQEVADHINRLKIPIEGAEDANGETTVTSFVRAEPYHAGMSHVQRADVHRAFVHDEVQVVVATLAFGMGIDKPGTLLLLWC
jgi:ATP-dependent DNA helicase RecQ